MEQIAPPETPLEGLAEQVFHEKTPEKRAEIVLEAAAKLHCRKFVTVQDVIKGHAKLNLAFTATLFNAHIGIHLPSEEEIQALLQERHANAVKIAELEAKLKAVTETREQEMASHAQELLAMHQSLESQQADLEASFHASLQDGLSTERKKWEDSYRRTFEREKEYKRNLERHLRQLRNLLLSVHGNNGSSNVISSNNTSPNSKSDSLNPQSTDDLEILTKEIVDMTKGLVLTNADLSVSCEKLKEKIKHNDRLNDVFGTKIREFSEFLIQERKRNPVSK